jgi:hypothetical protein
MRQKLTFAIALFYTVALNAQREDITGSMPFFEQALKRYEFWLKAGRGAASRRTAVWRIASASLPAFATSASVSALPGRSNPLIIENRRDKASALSD